MSPTKQQAFFRPQSSRGHCNGLTRAAVRVSAASPRGLRAEVAISARPVAGRHPASAGQIRRSAPVRAVPPRHPPERHPGPCVAGTPSIRITPTIVAGTSPRVTLCPTKWDCRRSAFATARDRSPPPAARQDAHRHQSTHDQQRRDFKQIDIDAVTSAMSPARTDRRDGQISRRLRLAPRLTSDAD